MQTQDHTFNLIDDSFFFHFEKFILFNKQLSLPNEYLFSVENVFTFDLYDILNDYA